MKRRGSEKTTITNVRVTDSERKLIKAFAEYENCCIGDVIRLAIAEAAERRGLWVDDFQAHGSECEVAQ